MNRLSLSELTTFLAIARHLNFRRAAAELGVTPSALSHALKLMEAKLEVRLVNRTTRSVMLSEVGEQLFRRLQPAFLEIDNALDDVDVYRRKPSGTLRLNAGVQGARLVLLPLVAAFLKRHPDISVDLVADDSLVDVVSDKFDAGVRFGERLHRDMIAIPLSQSMRSIIVGTKALLDQYGRPANPRKLDSIPCIRQQFPGGQFYRWEFERKKALLEVDVSGPLTVNSMDLALDAARQGVGLASVFAPMAQDAIESGQLEEVLGEWCPTYPGLYLYYPSRNQLPMALRAFVDFVTARLRGSA